MKNTRRLTFSAMLVALGAVLMLFGRYVEIFDLALVIAASFLVELARIEIRGAWPILIYFGTALSSFLLTGLSLSVLSYLLFGGVYPLLKQPIERHLPRPLSYAAKLLLANLALAAVTALSFFVLGLRLGFGIPHLVLLALLSNAVFLLYDYTLTRLAVRYFISIRPRIARLLK